MGLDMYLNKKSYVKNWDYMKEDEKHEVIVKKGGKLTHIKPDRVSYVEEKVGYWRKANAIHRWFVSNVQEGLDDCKEYEVSEEQMKELLELCKKVIASSELVEGKIKNGYNIKKGADGKMIEEPIWVEGKYIKNPKIAMDLLPVQEGFFFGSTSYDEYYLQDIIHTKEILESALSEPEESFYYSSSW